MWNNYKRYVFDVGKREVSDGTVSSEKNNEDLADDFNLRDERDRRAIDEEDDEDFLQELDMLEREVKLGHKNARSSRYASDR